MNKEDIKVVLLAGGKGTRIREETEITPKPMIKVGKIPVVEHIMNRYIKFDLNNFIICTGYKSEVINDYFANYLTSRDFSINTSNNAITSLNELPNFNLEVMFTGNETETGGRIYKIRDRIENDTFIVSYGDCLADVDIDKLYKGFFNSLLEKMSKDSKLAVPGTHMLFISKNLERIGDHATNVAETITYMASGEIRIEPRPKIN